PARCADLFRRALGAPSPRRPASDNLHVGFSFSRVPTEEPSSLIRVLVCGRHWVRPHRRIRKACRPFIPFHGNQADRIPSPHRPPIYSVFLRLRRAVRSHSLSAFSLYLSERIVSSQ